MEQQQRDTQAKLGSLTDSTAARVFTALQFWVRATRYEPTDAERELITNCEKRSTQNGLLAAVVGGSGGFALSHNLRQPMVSSIGVAAAAALVSSVYANHRSHLPCLCELLALGDESPLASQANRILGMGVPEAVRSIRRQMEAATEEPRRTAVTDASPDGSRGFDEGEAQPRAAAAMSRAAPAAKVANSWDRVRERFHSENSAEKIEPDSLSGGEGMRGESMRSRASQADDGSPAPDSWAAVRTAWALDGGRAAEAGRNPPARASSLHEPSEAAQGARRRKNAWGDDVFD